MTALFHNVRSEFMMALALHACVLGVVMVFGNVLHRHQETVVVYLTDEAPGGGPGTKQGGGSPAGKGAAIPGRISRTPPASLAKKATVDDPARDAKEESRPAVTGGVSGGAATGAGEGGSTGGTGDPSRAGSGGGSGGGLGRGMGTGRGADQNLRTQYLKEHFSRIRDLIMEHLTYPRMARKMGWKGRVVVAFVIRENGTVEKTRVVSSSGFDILDANALKTIMDVQPFPRPPIRAELVIPIVYKLE